MRLSRAKVLWIVVRDGSRIIRDIYLRLAATEFTPGTSTMTLTYSLPITVTKKE